MKALLFCIIFLILLSSCQDRKNILVTGTITDELTGKPIAKAEVVVLCWYMSGIDDAAYEKRTIITDEQGNYQARFAKGHQIDIAAKADGFNPDRNFTALEENQIQVNLRLAQARENPTLVKYLRTDYAADNIPFLRLRVYYNDNSSILDYTNVETFGFDFLALQTTTDIANCDIWFKPFVKDEQPYILIANKGGGIIPVYSHEFKSSFFYDKPDAPKQGYVHEYEFKGNEDGFFVLCRDGRTYGKIIFEKSLVSSGKSLYTDFGRYFSCLYQPNVTTDLSFSAPDIDLENFLVDGRIR